MKIKKETFITLMHFIIKLMVYMLIFSCSIVSAEPILWDTVGTDVVFDGSKSAPTSGERIGLIVSNFGEIGHMGMGEVSLDYFLSGEECGTRGADKVYLYSSSPFVIIGNSSTLTTTSLTTSINQLDDQKPHSWKAIAGPYPMSSGLSADGSYDSVFTGRMVNRDTTIGIERTFYAPRDLIDPGEFIVIRTLLFSVDGQAHNQVTFGSVTDWNIPSDSINMNSGIVSLAGDFAAIQGVDTANHENPLCINSGRYGTEVMIYYYKMRCSSCWGTFNKYGSFIGSQSLLEDTNVSKYGHPLTPPQPDPWAWWDEIGSNPGNNIDVGLPYSSNKALWNTIAYDINISVWDTLEIITAFVTLRDGNLTDLEASVSEANVFANLSSIIPVGPCSACCCGIRGDANMSDDVTVGDIGQIVNMLFGNGTQVGCLAEADANASSSEYFPQRSDITVGDIAAIVNFLFGNGELLPSCF